MAGGCQQPQLDCSCCVDHRLSWSRALGGKGGEGEKNKRGMAQLRWEVGLSV